MPLDTRPAMPFRNIRPPEYAKKRIQAAESLTGAACGLRLHPAPGAEALDRQFPV